MNRIVKRIIVDKNINKYLLYENYYRSDNSLSRIEKVGFYVFIEVI